MHFPLLKYNNQFTCIAKGIANYFGYQNTKDVDRYKGYRPYTNNWDGSFDAFKKENANGIERAIPDSNLKEFETYLDYCNKNNIKVIMAFAPVYYEEMLLEKSKANFIALFTNLAQKYNCTFLDYTTDTLCNHKTYFYNSQHLNKAGAEIYSLHLATDIKKIITTVSEK